MNTRRKQLVGKKGFALLEVLIGISLLSATIITVSSLTISMMRANSLNQNHLIATELAREGIELTRNIRDTNWNNYRNWLTDLHDGNSLSYSFVIDSIRNTGTGELMPSVSLTEDAKRLYKSEQSFYTLYSHLNTGKLTPFSREIIVTPLLYNDNNSDGADFLDSSVPGNYIFKVLVESKVTWTDRGNDREVSLTTELTDWNS